MRRIIQNGFPASTGVLLLQKERQGLKITMVFRIMWLLALLAGHLFTYQSQLELVLVASILLIAVISTVIFMFMLRKESLIRVAGTSGALMDVILIGLLPFIWYISVGAVNTTPAFMVKGALSVTIFLFMIVNGLALRPRYPVIIMTGASMILVILFVIIVLNPQTVYSYSFLDIFMGEAFSPIYFILTNICTVILAGIFLSLITAAARRTILKAVTLSRANSQMERYFSPNVVGSIINSEETFLKPGGRLQKVAVMFCDIRDFTSISESMKPEELLLMLSEYQSRMVKAIFHHGGTLDKFIGDGIMATFGTPEVSDDDALRAVKAGIEMKKELSLLNLFRMEQGLKPIRQGIGIDYGPVVAGNVGTESRLEYTVIGDTVNSASRIEGACKETGENFIISESVKNCLDDTIITKELAEISLKGKKKKIGLYAVMIDG
ncbi:MAG: adenylate/guanylate cyclase domain-containing protein [Spirochaetes bacterium]|nr:adenylate/guanylate cyclase domain-containing protein [Spirochaetota bacterium]MBN2769946.1 adenylate/guanylate cyclase domain-containing protein [Spirochaetota bacterium]